MKGYPFLKLGNRIFRLQYGAKTILYAKIRKLRLGQKLSKLFKLLFIGVASGRDAGANVYRALYD